MIKLKIDAKIDTVGDVTNITIPIGEKYLSKVIEELPSNVVLNKGVCGCGGTFLEMTCNRHSIIVVPFKSLIENKYQQHPDIYPVCGGHKFNKSTVNRISMDINNGKYVKIMTTYDSFNKVYGYLRDQLDPNIFFVLIDEWHILFNSYSFRESAIRDMTKTTKFFSNVTYMTATPVRREFIPIQLEDMPIINLTWKDNARVHVNKVNTNKPIHVATKIANEFITGKRFGNAHFFVNSVRDIVRIVKTLNIPPELIKVVCAKGAKNKRTLDGIENEDDLLTPKKVNFYTSTVFEGSDIMDEDGKIFVVSSGSSAALRTDIATSFTQIIGRIRNSKYATEVTHICSSISKGSLSADAINYDEYCELLEPRIKETKRLIAIYNNQSLEYRKEFGYIAKGKVTDFINYNEYEDKVEYDVNKERFAKSQHYILSEIYRNGFKINRSLKDAGYDVGEMGYEFITDEIKLNSTKRTTFEDLFKEYVTIKDSNLGDIPDRDDRLKLIAEINPLIEDAYETIGKDEVVKFEYGSSRIKRAIRKEKLRRFKNNSAMVARSSILKSFRVGTTEIKSEAIKKIQDIYNSLELITPDGDIFKAKASHLSEWFDVRESTMIIDKKQVATIKIR